MINKRVLTIYLKITHNDTTPIYSRDIHGQGHESSVMNIELVKLLFNKIADSSFNRLRFVYRTEELDNLDLNYYESLLSFQRQYLRDKQYVNLFQTNDSFLNEDIVAFIKDNQINLLILMSELQDERISEKMELLMKNKLNYELILRCSDRLARNIDDICLFLKSLEGLMNLHLYLPNIINQGILTQNNLSKILVGLFDYWFYDFECEFDIKLLTGMVLGLFGLPRSYCLFKESCATQAFILSVDSDGNAFPCDSNERRRTIIGNIKTDEIDQLMLDNINREKQKRADLKKISPSCCFCKWYSSCYGACLIHFNPSTKENQFCRDFKETFSYIHSKLKERNIIDDEENILVKDEKTIPNKALKKAILGL